MDFLKEMYEKSKKRAEMLEDFLWLENDFPVRSFGDALKKGSMSIIAEVKYATPSQGGLGLIGKPGELAKRYEESGASAISCLTEPEYFKGDMEYIRQIRSMCSIPVMMKDFITDKRQIMAGRMLGADAYLLITEMLSFEELNDLRIFGKSLGMDVLVEVHGEGGLEKALKIGAEIIGVNCRNLKTLEIDAEAHELMAGLLPERCIKVAESGIGNASRLKELQSLGYDAALIGRAMAESASRKEVFSCG